MGWYQSMPQLNLQSTKYVLPTAPNRPITLNGGMQVELGRYPPPRATPPRRSLPTCLTTPTHVL